MRRRTVAGLEDETKHTWVKYRLGAQIEKHIVPEAGKK